MKLNIHLVSHPIIQSLSSSITNQEILAARKNHTLKHLGLFLTYEAIRTWIKSYKLAIKQTKGLKEMTLIDPKESFIIVFNSIQYLGFFHEVQELIPKSRLELINADAINNSKDITIIEPATINSYTKIIIATYQLKSEYILNLVKQMTEKHKISIRRIRVACIVCKTNELIELSQQYSDLNIYTTAIRKT